MKRILIVDDEPHVIRVMRMALENAGYHVDDACNGLQALEYLQNHHPDVMITDIDMPCIDGRELCMQVKQNMPDRRFHIYVLTSRAEDEHREWSSTIDNLDFLEKPVSIRRLVAALKELFAATANDGRQSCQSAR